MCYVRNSRYDSQRCSYTSVQFGPQIIVREVGIQTDSSLGTYNLMAYLTDLPPPTHTPLFFLVTVRTESFLPGQFLKSAVSPHQVNHLHMWVPPHSFSSSPESIPSGHFHCKPQKFGFH